MRLESRQRTDVQQTLVKLPSLLDPRSGVIQSIDWYPVRPEDPQFVHCHATLVDSPTDSGRPAVRTAGGTALTAEIALGKAIGESVERYCGDVWEPDEVVIARYCDVRARATDPRRFALFLSEQYRAPDFPFVPITENSSIGWVRAFSLSRNEDTLVPAVLAHIHYQARTPEDCFDLCPVSGYACGTTLEEAILGAIYEVIERDAFMIFWYDWLPVPGLDLRVEPSSELWATLGRYSVAPVQLFCASITTDVGVPAILAAMTSRRPGWPAAVVATAADLDPQRAIVRALQELAANHLLIRWHMDTASRPSPRSFHEVVDQEDHALLYTAPQMLPYLDPVLRPRWALRPRDIGLANSEDQKENIDWCVQRLAKLDLEVLVVDLTPAPVESLGFKVVKVLIPGLQPLDFGVRWPHLGGRRLYEAPVAMGYRRVMPRPSELNLAPHPFP
jgi:ribosomal protein S12 methylthiotransferase accessory factor